MLHTKRTVRGVILIYEVLDIACSFSRNTHEQIRQRIPKEKGGVERQSFLLVGDYSRFRGITPPSENVHKISV